MVIAAGIGLVGTCVSAYAAVKAKRAESHTRPNGSGTIVTIVERIEDKVDGIHEWVIRHDEQHKQDQLPDRVEVLEEEQRWRP